ncbi:ATP-binding protein [Streptomyces carpaticus]|uniref:Uridine kinase n=1 Tax=Streptomyces harbinensis TaxID=1176198 RepID=A0A1I6TVF9_9ACTN|nr:MULTISPECIES: ATP-binding protein [Streptomyces]MCK1817760.1 ATP-binding protein [Streptomyces sp. XM4011]UWM50828.1 ATP-binding protein [Streptomyces carpaticus]SFS93223.1 uridine kinase [Streptomyces harbinensis]
MTVTPQTPPIPPTSQAEPEPGPRARVVLLTGPSGSGKSRLAARTGLPVLRLDDFYKEGTDPTLPPLPDGSGTDWDDPASWNADAALAAVRLLCGEGAAPVPVYDISSSSITGAGRLELGGAPLFVAEGIFAAEISAACRREGLAADTLCLRNRPLTTFRRRLVRDVRESRKSLAFLLRRGWKLMRAERGIVARHEALGAHACGRDEARARIARLTGAVTVAK